jgi:hypothetical protein
MHVEPVLKQCLDVNTHKIFKNLTIHFGTRSTAENLLHAKFQVTYLGHDSFQVQDTSVIWI